MTKIYIYKDVEKEDIDKEKKKEERFMSKIENIETKQEKLPKKGNR